MTLTLNGSDWDELLEQAPQPHSFDGVVDDFEELQGFPERFGCGYDREMEVSPGVWLTLFDQKLHQSWCLKVSAHEHSVQYMVLLSGLRHYEETYPTFGGERSYFSGSGISPSFTARYERSQRLVGINIDLLPEVLEALFPEIAGGAALLKLLLKQNDWKVSFFPKVTPAIRQVAQQIFEAPFYGATRRLYLQEKVFELLTLQFEAILSDQKLSQSLAGRKSERVARVYHAGEVLTSRLENPPSLLDLARQVGVSDCTLRRGFQDVFGTTVVGHLAQQRMKHAEQLLREGDCTVAEVANQVGYAHLGHFAAGFKRQFGITPRECLSGRRVAASTVECG
ncbi:MAG: helix-turn-helix transcriptional regulator [Leptolyngbyaceae cyanobacterium SM1_4_3]|nr:helix-turn-helix transcriptional regulator [Leptolyngbyaceae cyanobacterium SM1_4_3]